MSSQPLVSVAVPVHNGERYLRECVQSVLRQTLSDWELVLVDDGSTDGSASIAREFSDRRIRWEAHGSQRGQTAARNTAAQLARGRYVAVLDQDDSCFPSRLAEQVSFLEKNPDYAAVSAWKAKIDAHGKLIRRDSKSIMSSDELGSVLVFKMAFVHPATMFRRDVLSDYPHDEEYITANDYELMVRLSEKEKLWNLPRVLLAYRSHGENLSYKRAARAREEERRVIERQLDRIGVAFGDEDVERHLLLSKKDIEIDREFLESSEKWLRRLCAANDESRYREPAAFRSICAHRWLNICARGVKSAGLPSISEFFSSPLAAGAAAAVARRFAYSARYRVSGRF